MATSLGDKIRRLRKERDLSLEKLGELTESSKSYIWELENKNPPRPSAEKISRIAAVLGVTADYLVDTRESKPDASVVDDAFFRKYRNMDASTKEKIRQIVELWGAACNRDSSSQPSLIKGWHSDLVEADGIDKGRYHCPECGWRGYCAELQNETRGIADEPT